MGTTAKTTTQSNLGHETIFALPEGESQRVIIAAEGFGLEPLDRYSANEFNRLLHGDKPGLSPFKLTCIKGIYFIDFPKVMGEELKDTLVSAVTETDKAITDNFIAADIKGAWVVPDGTPEVSQLAPEDWANMTEVTTNVDAIVAERRSALFSEAVFNKLLY